MDARQRTFLLALAGLGIGVLALIGVAVLLMRGASAAAPSGATREEAAKVSSDERVADPQKQSPPPEESPRAQPNAGSVARQLVVYDGAVKRISCEAACYFEGTCGFRDEATCRAASCEREFRKINTSDFKMGQANTCDVLALIPCEESCWRRGECAGDHTGDEACTSACITLGRQLPRETYRESRCVIESACSELPLCGGLGPAPPRDTAAVDAGPADAG